MATTQTAPTGAQTQTLQTTEAEVRVGTIKQVAKLVTDGHLVLPKDYSYENAIGSAMYKLTEAGKDGKSAMEKCSTLSIQKSLRKMVMWGLTTDKDQVYFVPYGTTLTCQRGYAGNKALAKRLGMNNIAATCVYAKDDFAYNIIEGVPHIERHNQSLANIDESAIIGAYAVATMNDGRKIIDIMTIAQIRKSWEQGRGTDVHNKFTTEMAKKTVISRLCKQIINESDDATLYDDEQSVEQTNNVSKPVAPSTETLDISHTVVVEENTTEEKPTAGGKLFPDE